MVVGKPDGFLIVGRFIEFVGEGLDPPAETYPSDPIQMRSILANADWLRATARSEELRC